MSFPKLDLTTFFLSVSTAAMQSMNSQPADMTMAKQNIYLLELMHTKTQGNRTPEEEQLINHLLFQVRMSFVESEKRK